MTDNQPLPDDLTVPTTSMYIDNFVCVCNSPEVTASCVDRALKYVRGLGYECHEVTSCSRTMSALGVELSGDPVRSSPSQTKITKLVLGTRHACVVGKATSMQLGRLVGLLTFACL